MNHGLQVTTSFLFWNLDHSMKVLKTCDQKPWFSVEFYVTCFSDMHPQQNERSFEPGIPPHSHDNIDLPRADKKDEWEESRSLSPNCINPTYTPGQLRDFGTQEPPLKSFMLLLQLCLMPAGIGEWLLEMLHAGMAGSTTNLALFVHSHVVFLKDNMVVPSLIGELLSWKTRNASPSSCVFWEH